MHRAARRGHVRAEALVVLHVAAGQVFRRGVVEFSEQICGYFAKRIHQHIQAASVCHADHDFLHANFARALNQLVHAGNKALATFKRKALLANVFGV